MRCLNGNHLTLLNLGKRFGILLPATRMDDGERLKHCISDSLRQDVQGVLDAIISRLPATSRPCLRIEGVIYDDDAGDEPQIKDRIVLVRAAC